MRTLFILLSFFILFSCNNTAQKEKNEDQNLEQNLNTPSKITNSIGEIIIPENRKLIEDWKEYKDVEKLIEEYYNITPQQALTNAENLAKNIKLLKDSIRIDKFKSNDIKIRINVLYNNALNLSQLNTLIKKDSEVIKNEVANTLESFSALNSKLNNITTQEILEEELKDFNN